MTNVEITYNPYKVKAKILVDGEGQAKQQACSIFE